MESELYKIINAERKKAGFRPFCQDFIAEEALESLLEQPQQQWNRASVFRQFQFFCQEADFEFLTLEKMGVNGANGSLNVMPANRSIEIITHNLMVNRAVLLSSTFSHIALRVTSMGHKVLAILTRKALTIDELRLTSEWVNLRGVIICKGLTFDGIRMAKDDNSLEIAKITGDQINFEENKENVVMFTMGFKPKTSDFAYTSIEIYSKELIFRMPTREIREGLAILSEKTHSPRVKFGLQNRLREKACVLSGDEEHLQHAVDFLNNRRKAFGLEPIAEEESENKGLSGQNKKGSVFDSDILGRKNGKISVFDSKISTNNISFEMTSGTTGNQKNALFQRPPGVNNDNKLNGFLMNFNQKSNIFSRKPTNNNLPAQPMKNNTSALNLFLSNTENNNNKSFLETDPKMDRKSNSTLKFLEMESKCNQANFLESNPSPKFNDIKFTNNNNTQNPTPSFLEPNPPLSFNKPKNNNSQNFQPLTNNNNINNPQTTQNYTIYNNSQPLSTQNYQINNKPQFHHPSLQKTVNTTYLPENFPTNNPYQIQIQSNIPQYQIPPTQIPPNQYLPPPMNPACQYLPKNPSLPMYQNLPPSMNTLLPNQQQQQPLLINNSLQNCIPQTYFNTESNSFPQTEEFVQPTSLFTSAQKNPKKRRIMINDSGCKPIGGDSIKKRKESLNLNNRHIIKLVNTAKMLPEPINTIFNLDPDEFLFYDPSIQKRKIEEIEHHLNIQPEKNKNFSEMYKSNKCTDVILMIKKEEYRLHKFVLMRESKFFKEAMENSGNDLVRLSAPDFVTKKPFELLIKFLYMGRFDPDDLKEFDAFLTRDVFILACFFSIPNLVNFLGLNLLLSKMTCEICVDVLRESTKLVKIMKDKVPLLLNYYTLNFLSGHLKSIFNSDPLKVCFDSASFEPDLFVKILSIGLERATDNDTIEKILKFLSKKGFCGNNISEILTNSAKYIPNIIRKHPITSFSPTFSSEIQELSKRECYLIYFDPKLAFNQERTPLKVPQTIGNLGAEVIDRFKDSPILFDGDFMFPFVGKPNDKAEMLISPSIFTDTFEYRAFFCMEEQHACFLLQLIGTKLRRFSVLKFVSVLVKLAVWDRNQWREFVFFHSFADNGEVVRVEWKLPFVEEERNLKFRLWINENPLHSGCLHYSAENLERLLKENDEKVRKTILLDERSLNPGNNNKVYDIQNKTNNALNALNAYNPNNTFSNNNLHALNAYNPNNTNNNLNALNAYNPNNALTNNNPNKNNANSVYLSCNNSLINQQQVNNEICPKDNHNSMIIHEVHHLNETDVFHLMRSQITKPKVGAVFLAKYIIGKETGVVEFLMQTMKFSQLRMDILMDLIKDSVEIKKSDYFNKRFEEEFQKRVLHGNSENNEIKVISKWFRSLNDNLNLKKWIDKAEEKIEEIKKLRQTVQELEDFKKKAKAMEDLFNRKMMEPLVRPVNNPVVEKKREWPDCVIF